MDAVDPRRRAIPKLKKVEVVYYLSKNNGQLDHPHYIQLTHLAHQHLRLKDVMNKLTALRGKGMPSLYSWSCKRSYKNGYVWNDLAQNDVIYPSQGGEYVLKGSQLLVGFAEKLHHLQVGMNQQTPPKRKPSDTKRQPENAAPEEEEEEDEYEEKTMHNIVVSRGVSTDEIEELKTQPPNELTNLGTGSHSPPSTTTTSSTHSGISSNTLTATSYARYEDGDPSDNEPMLSRNSMMFSLIACGGSVSFRKGGAPAPANEEEEVEMIEYMSENPRMFGNVEKEKEYFSGSMAEAVANEERLGGGRAAGLMKSSSFNQERSIKAELEEVEDKVVKKEKGLKLKCIPRKKSSSKKK